MNYEYYIDRDRIFEVEKDGRKIPTDLYGDSIRFLIENQKTMTFFYQHIRFYQHV